MHYLKKALLFVFILEFSINFYAQDTTAVITDKPLDAEIVQWLNAYLGNYNLDYKSLSADWDYKNKYAFDQILQIAYNDDKFKGKEDPDYAVKVALSTFIVLYTNVQSKLKGELSEFRTKLRNNGESKEVLIPYIKMKLKKRTEAYNNKVAELEKKNAELKKDLAEQKKDLAEQKKASAQKEAIIEELKERNKELERIIVDKRANIEKLLEVKRELEENTKKMNKKLKLLKEESELLKDWLDMQKRVQEAIEKNEQ